MEDNFNICLANPTFRKNNIINIGVKKYKVIKVYKYNWWKKLLNSLGFKFKQFNAIKVIEHGERT